MRKPAAASDRALACAMLLRRVMPAWRAIELARKGAAVCLDVTRALEEITHAESSFETIRRNVRHVRTVARAAATAAAHKGP